MKHFKCHKNVSTVVTQLAAQDFQSSCVSICPQRLAIASRPTPVRVETRKDTRDRWWKKGEESKAGTLVDRTFVFYAYPRINTLAPVFTVTNSWIKSSWRSVDRFTAVWWNDSRICFVLSLRWNIVVIMCIKRTEGPAGTSCQQIRNHSKWTVLVINMCITRASRRRRRRREHWGRFISVWARLWWIFRRGKLGFKCETLSLLAKSALPPLLA